MKTTEKYEAPLVETIEVMVEKGYEVSINGSSSTGDGMSGGGTTNIP